MGRWVKYNNGNYTVYIDTARGTKIRETDCDHFEAEFPESMDVKICNRCDMGCPMCHEDSTPDGDIGEIMNVEFIKNLHPYTEIALGGGNVFEHPDLIPFLEQCRELSLIANITVNQKHFIKNLRSIYYMLDNRLIYGIGISLTDANEEFIRKVKEFPNAVIHVINGVVTIDQLNALAHNNLKLLILGYKQFRRGKTEYGRRGLLINDRMNALSEHLPKMLRENEFEVVSFDNLALKQLNVKSLLSEEEWSQFYMGDDGIDGEMTSASMYVDLVKKEFARNSTSTERYPLMSTAKDMYQFLKQKGNKNV